MCHAVKKTMLKYECEASGFNKLDGGSKFIKWFDSVTIYLPWPLQSLNSLNNIIELRHSDFQQNGMCDQQSVRSACAYAQSDQSLCLSLEYSMGVKLLTEHHLECLSLKGGCTGSSESTLVKIPHCWKSCVASIISWNILVID